MHFSFALAGHRGTCQRLLHIFALLCLLCFACKLRSKCATVWQRARHQTMVWHDARRINGQLVDSVVTKRDDEVECFTGLMCWRRYMLLQVHTGQQLRSPMNKTFILREY